MSMIFCRGCGKEIHSSAPTCPHCGAPQQVPNSCANDAALRAILPVGRSGYAIAAGYLALFSILILPAPFALIFGILAIRDIKKNPEKHGMGRAIFGVVMGGLCTLVFVIVVLTK
ncbi:MAG: DUF4190 domain-containing protein [Gallionella sp.]|nr:DUF4190 domain-containing protein [Gallionella sp.]